MKQFHRILAVAALGVFAHSALAAEILIVSDRAADNSAEAPLIAFLTNLGHTVNTAGMNKNFKEGTTSPFVAGNEAKLASLQAADLVLFSRLTGSGDYDADTAHWNTLDTPLLLMSGYLTRGSAAQQKWFWTNGDSGDALKATTDMLIVGGQEGHPFVAGLSSPAGLFDFSSRDPAEAPKAVYLPLTPFPDAATLVGTFDGKPMLVDIPVGTTLFNGNVTGERRAFFAHWGYDNASTDTFGDYITDDYRMVLGNVIGTMVPEPSSIGLLAIGALGLIRRRR